MASLIPAPSLATLLVQTRRPSITVPISNPLTPPGETPTVPSLGLPACAACTRTQRRPSPPHSLLLSTYLWRRLEGLWAGQDLPLCPHPAAVESHGPPPAPITKQHNNRLSEFR